MGVMGAPIRMHVAVIVAMAVAVLMPMLMPMPMLMLMLMLMLMPAAPVLPVRVPMLMSMPLKPMSTGFSLFMTVCFGFADVTHWWLPGSICGLVNTLKPLQGQGRYPEGP
ncbi:hypothetical protein PQQ53_01770 [Paraburkholderia strydomiana]|uniref:hypothetical protein n=1 Tax=Paraburkholderia strydomiana TaxID=1245417 RepID=UPI0038B82FA3